MTQEEMEAAVMRKLIENYVTDGFSWRVDSDDAQQQYYQSLEQYYYRFCDRAERVLKGTTGAHALRRYEAADSIITIVSLMLDYLVPGKDPFAVVETFGFMDETHTWHPFEAYVEDLKKRVQEYNKSTTS